MRKLRVLTVVGTRPEIIRLSRVMALLDRETEHILVHTGQNYDYELNEVFFRDLELRKPDHFLEAAGSGPADTIGHVISRIDPILADRKPDAFLVLGDTNSCLPPSAPRGARSQYFIWRPATAASISACRKRSTGKSSITSATSTLLTAALPASISSAKASRPIGSSRPEALCTKCCATTTKGSAARTCWSAYRWSSKGTLSSAPIVRKTSSPIRSSAVWSKS